MDSVSASAILLPLLANFRKAQGFPMNLLIFDHEVSSLHFNLLMSLGGDIQVSFKCFKHQSLSLMYNEV